MYISSYDICDCISNICYDSNLLDNNDYYCKFKTKNILNREIDIIKNVNINSIINENN
jgi:hypothetical protein